MQEEEKARITMIAEIKYSRKTYRVVWFLTPGAIMTLHRLEPRYSTRDTWVTEAPCSHQAKHSPSGLRRKTLMILTRWRVSITLTILSPPAIPALLR